MIQANILELLGAFALGAIVMLATLWTLVSTAIAEADDLGDDEDDDDIDDDGDDGDLARAGA